MSTVIKPRRGANGARLRDLPDVLQMRDVAALLGCARSTAYELVRSGRLPACQVTDHRYVVAKSAFVAWLEKGIPDGI